MKRFFIACVLILLIPCSCSRRKPDLTADVGSDILDDVKVFPKMSSLPPEPAAESATGSTAVQRKTPSKGPSAEPEPGPGPRMGTGRPEEAPRGKDNEAEPSASGSTGKETRAFHSFPEVDAPVVALQTERGVVYVELFPQEAPKTVANFLKLVRQGFYDGIKFHRREEGFVVQVGDPQTRELPLNDPRIGTGGPGYTIQGEFSSTLKHERGTVAMARASDPDSAGSQFYICLARTRAHEQLDGKYAIFGRVIEGMAVVDEIRVGDVLERVVVVQDPGHE